MRCLVAAILLVLSLAPASAQVEDAEAIVFPTSGSAEAQPHFLRAVTFLHSFGWKQAIAEFREAQRLDPGFAMAYWGETLCYNHPLANEGDARSPRDALARLGPTPAARLAKAPTDREKGFLGAVEVLWGEGDWRTRRVDYMHAMERLARQYPDDDEARAFYAVALLSGARALRDDTLRYEMQAGAAALDVSRHNPKHPGALHYAIHAFDDPIHAPLALHAASTYAALVPDVSHAVHMPTHIFIQLGRWSEVASQNVRAFNVARDLYQPGDDPGDLAHAGDWAHYGFLQLGDYGAARDRIDALEAVAAELKSPRLNRLIEVMRARYVVESEEWIVLPVADDALAETVFANGMSAVHIGDRAVAAQMLEKLAGRSKARAATADPHAAHGGQTDQWADQGAGSTGAAAASRSLPATAGPPGEFLLSPADEGETAAIPVPALQGRAVWRQIMHDELAATIAMAEGRHDEAISLLTRAAELEVGMRPPSGPPDVPKPAHELLGEALIEAGRVGEAAAAFDTSLLRMPNRPRSLMGAARAYTAAGDAASAEARYETLMSFWKGPVPDLRNGLPQ
jgi:tetratricopeptide (TPR) repeat protein